MLFKNTNFTPKYAKCSILAPIAPKNNKLTFLPKFYKRKSNEVKEPRNKLKNNKIISYKYPIN